jgi:CDP-glucose 4,6-dehydratase
MEKLVTFEDLRLVYKNKKILITGHTGFKGSWLLKIFNIMDAKVLGYSLDTKTDDDLFNLIEGEKRCTSIIADIRNRENLIATIIDFKPDFIFHLAAQPLVRLSYNIPAETFEVNAIGTANLLDGVRQLNNPCSVVIITTDKVYYNNEWVYPYRENDRLGGYDPYSASKACAELVIESYRSSYFNINQYHTHQKSIAVARAGNVIGGGDWSQNRLIPDIVKALSANNPISIRNSHAVRPWQHVLEPLKGYLLLGASIFLEPTKYAQAYNFGPYTSDTLSVENIVRLAINAWGSGSYKLAQEVNQPHEAGLLKLDISKTEAELNWHPQEDATEAINMTINWYKTYYNDKNNIVTFTERQIMNFFSKHTNG